MPKPLSSEFLLNRGKCCGNSCKNCPNKNQNMQKEEKEKKFLEVIELIRFPLEVILEQNSDITKNEWSKKVFTTIYLDKILEDIKKYINIELDTFRYIVFEKNATLDSVSVKNLINDKDIYLKKIEYSLDSTVFTFGLNSEEAKKIFLKEVKKGDEAMKKIIMLVDLATLSHKNKGTSYYKTIIKGKTGWYYASPTYGHEDYNKTRLFDINPENDKLVENFYFQLDKLNEIPSYDL